LGVTSIYVTHDQVEAMTLADRIVVMRDGRIEQSGTPMQLFNKPANIFVAGFLGSPPMNQLKSTLAADGDELHAVVAGSKIKLAAEPALKDFVGKDIILGIRPEHVLVSATESSSALNIALDLIEPLGSEALLHASIDGQAFVVKAETHGVIDHLKNLTELHIDQNKVAVFDAETGNAISHPKTGAENG